LCLSETWLTPSDKIPEFVGYKFFQAPFRLGDRGVAIISREEFKVTVFENHQFELSANVELLSLKVQLNFNKSFLVTCIYRNTNYDCLTLHLDNTLFFNLLSELVQLNCPFFVLGDFNLPNDHIIPLSSTIDNLGLIQLINEPTRLNNILDLIITNNMLKVEKARVSEFCLADHNLTYCVANVPKRVKEKNLKSFRVFNNITIENFVNDLNSILNQHLFPGFLSTCPSLLLEHLVKSILLTVDNHAPVIQKSFYRRRKRIFVSSETRNLIAERNSLYKLYKRNPQNTSILNALNLLKKKVKLQILRDSKSEFDFETSSSGVWNSLRKLYPLSAQVKSSTTCTADMINDYYVSISLPTNDSTNNTLPSPPLKIQSQLIRVPYFSFSTLSTDTVLKIWKSTKNPNSTTLDTLNISLKMFDICFRSDKFLSFITDFFNCCISTKCVPDSLKCSKVIPIPKINNASEPNDLRPISIQPVILKLFEKCLVPQLVSHLESNNLLCPEQYGFRKAHSTQHALIQITETIRTAIRNKKICIMIVLDFKKAFDKVDRDVLKHKLKWYNIDPDLIFSLLSNRKQCVNLTSSERNQVSRFL